MMKNLPSGVTIPSGGGAQISNTRWVDAGAAGGGNGSIGAPFQTCQDGLDALADLPGTKANLLVFPGLYGEASPTWEGTQELLVGNACPGYWVLGGSNVANQPYLNNQFICGTGLVSFAGIELFEGFTSEGAVDCFGCKVWQLSDSSLNSNFRQCTLIGVVGSFGSLALDSCRVDSGSYTMPLSGTTIIANTIVSGSTPPDVVFVGAPGVLLIDNMFDYWWTLTSGSITNGTKTLMA